LDLFYIARSAYGSNLLFNLYNTGGCPAVHSGEPETDQSI
jgi:hypothetical protein